MCVFVCVCVCVSVCVCLCIIYVLCMYLVIICTLRPKVDTYTLRRQRQETKSHLSIFSFKNHFTGGFKSTALYGCKVDRFLAASIPSNIYMLQYFSHTLIILPCKVVAETDIQIFRISAVQQVNLLDSRTVLKYFYALK